MPRKPLAGDLYLRGDARDELVLCEVELGDGAESTANVVVLLRRLEAPISSSTDTSLRSRRVSIDMAIWL